MSNRKISIIKIGDFLLPCVSVIVVCLFPVVFMYAQNVSEALLADCLIPAALFCGCGLALWLAESLISRDPAKSALATVLTMLLMLNFALIEKLALKINIEVRYWHVLAVLLVVIIQGTGLIFKKLPKGAGEMAVQILPLVFGALIVVNVVTAIPTLLARSQAEKELQHDQAVASESSGKSQPNIYFLVFDEYANNAQMLKHYDYDNSELTNHLQELGFSVSFTGHNESIITSTITTNLVNLDYIVDNTWPEFDKKAKRHSGELFKLLENNHYDLYEMVSNGWYGLPTQDGNGTSGTAKTASGDTIGDILMKGTVIYPLVKQPPTSIQKPMDEIINFSRQHRNDSQFVLAHFNLPHPPFIYDRNGDYRSNINSDWHDKSFYLEQYMFAGKVMDELATSILENDPECILIIQSDHGARASTSADLFMEIFELDEMNNFFNAVYYSGQKVDIEGLSGVNTLRTVVNRLFGMEMEMVPVPVDTYKYK